MHSFSVKLENVLFQEPLITATAIHLLKVKNKLDLLSFLKLGRKGIQNVEVKNVTNILTSHYRENLQHHEHSQSLVEKYVESRFKFVRVRTSGGKRKNGKDGGVALYFQNEVNFEYPNSIIFIEQKSAK